MCQLTSTTDSSPCALKCQSHTEVLNCPVLEEQDLFVLKSNGNIEVDNFGVIFFSDFKYLIVVRVSNSYISPLFVNLFVAC